MNSSDDGFVGGSLQRTDLDDARSAVGQRAAQADGGIEIGNV